MAWGRLDDGIIDHPKFAALAATVGLKLIERIAAVGLWTKGNAYCAKHLTDGFIPRVMVPSLASVPPRLAYKLAEALVAARGRSEFGLWEHVEDGYQVHDWQDWNRSKERVTAIRSLKAEAGRLGGLRSGEARRKHRASYASQATTKHAAAEATNSHPIPVVIPQPSEAPASQGKTSHPTYGRQADGSYLLHDGMFNDCPQGRDGMCVKTEYLTDVPTPAQCELHRPNNGQSLRAADGASVRQGV
jgi:hypothetical protein